MKRAAASAKINLALVVGPRREDGYHELVTVYQRVALADRLTVTRSSNVEVSGFDGDTLVRGALQSLPEGNGGFSARIEKRIPVAAGLGGGSSDAAAALRLANELLEDPVADLHPLAAALGSDVPFFLRDGPQLGTGDGSELEALDLPQDYWIVLALPRGASKISTAEVYSRFDGRDRAGGFAARRSALVETLHATRRRADLALLPTNDLASSPFAERLRALGAFRADVSGAGPAVYGLFAREPDAHAAAAALDDEARTWITVPAWYG